MGSPPEKVAPADAGGKAGAEPRTYRRVSPRHRRSQGNRVDGVGAMTLAGMSYIQHLAHLKEMKREEERRAKENETFASKMHKKGKEQIKKSRQLFSDEAEPLAEYDAPPKRKSGGGGTSPERVGKSPGRGPGDGEEELHIDF